MLLFKVKFFSVRETRLRACEKIVSAAIKEIVIKRAIFKLIVISRD